MQAENLRRKVPLVRTEATVTGRMENQWNGGIKGATPSATGPTAEPHARANPDWRWRRHCHAANVAAKIVETGQLSKSVRRKFATGAIGNYTTTGDTTGFGFRGENAVRASFKY
jgi:hypothetical protein